MYGLFLHPHVHIPLSRVQITSTTNHFACKTHICQEYLFPATAAQAKYVFPIPPRCAVNQFFAVLELLQRQANDAFLVLQSETIQGTVKAKAQAKQEYETNKLLHQGAMLLEESAQQNNILELDLFVSFANMQNMVNCVPRVTVHIGMVHELEQEANMKRFVLPCTLTPKYEPQTANTSVDQTTMVYHSQVPYRVSINLQLKMESDITSVTCASHEMATVQVQGKEAQVVLDQAQMDKDFVALIGTNDLGHVEPAIIEQYQGKYGALGAKYAIMVPVVPKIMPNAPLNAELIFVVDCSGSMEGAPMQQAFRACKLMIQSIPMGVHFNVILFGSNFVSMFPSSLQLNDSTLDAAKQFLNSNEKDLGGTELMAPLKHIFASKPITGTSRQLFILTDGAIFNTKEVIKEIRNHAHLMRVFTFGLGDSVDRYLVQGMSRAGEGNAVFISNAERIEAKVMEQLTKSFQPSISNINVSLNVPYGVEPCYQVIPPVFAFEKFVYYAFFDEMPSNNTVQVTVTYSDPATGKDEQVVYPVSTIIHDEYVHALAAKKKIEECEELGLVDGQSQLEKLGTSYQLLSSYTSFVAVSKQHSLTTQYSNYSIPLQSPAGFSHHHHVHYHASARRGSLSGFRGGRGGSRGGGRGSVVAAQATFDPAPQAEFSRMKKRNRARPRLGSDEDAEPTSTEQDRLLDSILFSQTAKGTWVWNAQLLQQMSITKLNNCTPSDGLMTALCILYVERNYVSRKVEWQLIVQRAKNAIDSSFLNIATSML